MNNFVTNKNLLLAIIIWQSVVIILSNNLFKIGKIPTIYILQPVSLTRIILYFKYYIQ